MLTQSRSTDITLTSIELTSIQAAPRRTELQPLLNWAHGEYTYSFVINAAGCVGVIVASIATSSSFFLGEYFGNMIAKEASANAIFTTILKTIFGIITYGPTAVLISFPNFHEARNLAAYVFREPQLPTRADFKKTQRIAMMAARFMAAFSGLPFYYLAQYYYNDVPGMQFIAPPTALWACYMATMSVGAPLVNNLFVKYANRYERKELSLARKRVVATTSYVLKILNTMPDTQIKALSERIKECYMQDASPADKMLTVVELLLKKVPEESANLVNRNANRENKISCSAVTTNFVAGSFGLGANVIIYGLTTSAMESFGINKIGNQITEDALTNGAATLAMITNMYFGMKYAIADARFICNSIAQGHYMPSFNTSTAHIIAACSAVSQTVVAAQNGETPLDYAITGVTFVGTTMARALAFMMLQNVITDYFKKSSPNAICRNIIAMVQKIHDGVPMLDGVPLLALDALIHPVRPVINVEINIAPQAVSMRVDANTPLIAHVRRRRFC